MSGLNFSRQHGLFRPEQALSPVTVIGAGGIGASTVLALARMGVPDITVLDFDTVEEHNRASQGYRRIDIGRPKVEALADIVESFTDACITARAERYVDQSLSGLVISAVDVMEVRMQIWETVKLNPNVDLFIDGRMGGLVSSIFTARPCDPDDIRRYGKHLFPSSQAAATPCTERAIAYNTLGIASQICSIVRNWWIRGEAPGSVHTDIERFTVLSD